METLERVDLVSRINRQSIVALLSESETAVISKIVPHFRLGHNSVSDRRVGIVGGPVESRSLVSPSVEGIVQYIDHSVPFTLDKALLNLTFVDFASFSCKQITVDVFHGINIVGPLLIIVILLSFFQVGSNRICLVS